MLTITHKMNKYIPATVLLLAFAACGPTEDGDEVSSDPAQSELLDGSRRVLPVDFASARGHRLSAAERVQRASRVLLQGAPDTTLVEDLGDPERPEGRAAGAVSARPTLRISHDPGTGELLLINGPVADDHSEGIDIGEAAARRIFEDTVAQLARDGMDDMTGVDLSKVRVSRLHQASGLAGRSDTLRSSVKAYVFSAPRTVNGLEILHSSITIGVHRSGKLASIHSRGLLPGTTPASPALAAPRDRAAGSAELQRRAQAEFPDAHVHSVGLVYAVLASPDKLASAVEPREVFLVFPRLGDASGHGRGRMVAYSVTDPRAAATYLDTQLANDPGDVRR